MSNSEQLVIYQLHIFILGISPMIWRRVQVRSDSTIADLHYIIQIAMGWTDSHEHIASSSTVRITALLKLGKCRFLMTLELSSYQIWAGEGQNGFYTNMTSVITGSIKLELKQFLLPSQII